MIKILSSYGGLRKSIIPMFADLIQSRCRAYIFKILFFSILFCVISVTSIEAVEIRAIINDSVSTRESLIHKQAIFQGNYAFTDHISAIARKRAIVGER